MKNIIVVSDTHNRLPQSEIFWEALDHADFIFHLGDGARDIEKLKQAYPGKLIYVYGNCDLLSGSPEQDKVIAIEGVKFFLTHGHRYRVKSSDIDLQMRGVELGVDCCLYGHTHRAEINGYGALTLINPGSLTYSRSYCYICVKDKKIIARIATLSDALN